VLLSEKERTRRENFVEEISNNAEETLDFKRGDIIMVKARHFFFPPNLTRKELYDPFTVTRVCKKWEATLNGL